MIGITSARVRAIVTDCTTEMEVAKTLRKHRIKYTFTTETGTLSIRIPCRTGAVRVYRTCSRATRFAVTTVSRKCGISPIPVLYAND